MAKPPIHTVEVPMGKCGGCGKEMDRATAFRHDASPQPGDLTMCLECGLLHVFTDELKLKALSAEEFAALPEGLRAELTFLLALRQKHDPFKPSGKW
jgi:hypothetical protein